MTYRYKTAPMPHQRKVFSETANLPAYALFFEQGVGKSKPLIDTACYLYQQGQIGLLIVVAPNGVHRNWVSDEIPKHMPDEVQASLKTMIWTSSTFKTKRAEAERKQLMEWHGLAVLVVAYEATITEKFKTYVWKLVKERRTMIVLDESHRIKSAESRVKTRLVALGKLCPYRRLATGTPTETPLDVYPQMRFLDQHFWERNGFQTYEDFKQHFAVQVDQRFGARSFSKIVDYKNLDELATIIKQLSWRLTKETAGLNLPPKVYSKRYHEMTPEQNRVYTKLRDEFRVELENGKELKGESSITRMLRLQQVACGFVSTEAEQPSERIDPRRNPRMDLAVDEILADLPHQAIIFHRFRADLEDMLQRLGTRAVPYHGGVKDDERARSKAAFQAGDVQFFVASKAASTGLTLVGAKTTIFYSNSFELITRLQAEDRNHRVGQANSVNYIDLIAQDTIDEYIVSSLGKKFDLASQVNQDEIRAWI